MGILAGPRYVALFCTKILLKDGPIRRQGLRESRRYARIRLEVPVFFNTSITIDMPVILNAFHGLPHRQPVELKGATFAYPQTLNRGPLTGPPAA